MPNCASLSEAETETVRKFVRNGGGLVATYETSLYDEHARPRENFGLADLLNAKPVGAFDNRQMRVSWDKRLVHNAHLHFPPEHRWSADPVILKTLSVRSVNQPTDTITRSVPLHCQMLYQSDAKCPVIIRQLKRRKALRDRNEGSSEAMARAVAAQPRLPEKE